MSKEITVPQYHGLSEESIKERLFSKNISERLIVSPLIDIDKRIQKNTITVSLGTKFIIMKGTRYSAIDPFEVNDTEIEEILDKTEIEFDEQIVLRPSQMILAGTFEYISLPHDISAQVGPRSTYGRLALIPATATYVHPGFKGCLTLELVNVGSDPMILYPRMEVAQLVLQYHDGTNSDLNTRYKLPVGPEFPKLWKDTNIDKLRKFRSSIVKK